MSQTHDSFCVTFEAGGAISQYARVKITSGKLAVAGIYDADIGVAERQAFADGDVIPVRLLNSPTQKVIAAGAISQGAYVYTAANGKVSATKAAGSHFRGVALEAASADGDIIEIQPIYA